MEVRFTETEKMAIANVLFNLADADFQSHKEEKECLEECLKELELDTKGFSPISKSELPAQTYETLRRMTMEKKRELSRSQLAPPLKYRRLVEDYFKQMSK